jgi:glucokinase
MNEYLAGFDVGGTKLALMIADRAGRIITKLWKETDVGANRFADYKDGIAYLGLGEQMVRMLREALREVRTDMPAAIGIGAAGPLKDGDIYNSTNIKLTNPLRTGTGVPEDAGDKPLYIPLVGPLKEEFNLPIRLENDCIAAVKGEVQYGVGKGVQDKSELHLVYVTLSTGLGAGVWDEGHLLTGKQGNAAEVGHFLVKEGGLKCGCGNYGCAEAYCSGRGIAKNARMRLINEELRFEDGYGAMIKELALKEARKDTRFQEREPSDWELLEFVTSPIVFNAATKGDGLAQKVIDEACYYGGIALADIANAYDPKIITVGGALAQEHPEILAPMREGMLRHLNVEPPEVLLTPLGYEVVEFGALVLAREALEEESG